MTPSELNAVARLVFIAKRCGADFLDNADSFDNMIGAGRFAETDRKVLDMVRRVVKPLPDCRLDNWVCPSEMKKNTR